MPVKLVGLQHVNDVRFQFGVFGRKAKVKAGRLGVKCRQKLSLLGDESFFHQSRPDGFRCFAAKWFLNLAVHPRQAGESQLGNFAKRHAAILLVFGLQRAGEFIVAFVGDNQQLVNRLVENPLAVLIHRQAQAAADFLPLAECGARFIQGANLKHVRIVPAFAQRRMAEDEAQRHVERQQQFLLLHYQLVSGFIRFGGAAFAGFLEHAFFVRGKIAVVQLLDRERQQILVALLRGKFFESLFKKCCELALQRTAILGVVPVI